MSRLCGDNMTQFWSYIWQHHWSLEIKITKIQKRWLTLDFHAHCAINRNTYSIVSCTTVCSICTSLDITQDIVSIHNWKQRCTVCNIIFHFRPIKGSWCWFTSCITTQNNQRAFTNHLIMTHTSDFRGNCKIKFKKAVIWNITTVIWVRQLRWVMY